MRTRANGNPQKLLASQRRAASKELGIQLPSAPAPFGTYVETVQSGDFLFLSGTLPVVDRKPKFIGRLGKELNTEAGRDAAYIAALNVLARPRSIWAHSIE